MKRRDFLGITAVGVAGLACPGEATAGTVSRVTLAHPQLLDLLRNEELVAALGRRYRDAVPSENDAHVLEAAILADAPAGASAEPRRWLADRIQQDFARGETVTLNGWVLSRTEARQAALFSLWIA